jgi:hypothetical protein
MIPFSQYNDGPANFSTLKGDSWRMNAQEAEAEYSTIKSQFEAGQIPLDEYNRRVSDLRYQDNTGTWWTISPVHGSWLRWNGTVWEIAFEQKTLSKTVQQQGTPGSALPPVHGGALQELTVSMPADKVQTHAIRPPISAGKKYAAGSIACGVISFFIFPYILGCAGILLGIVALKEKYTPGAIGILISAAVIPIAFLTTAHP